MISKWHRELDIFYQIKSGLILEGNINDVYSFPEEGDLFEVLMPLPQYLYYFFKQRNYDTVVHYDMLNGFTAPYDKKDLQSFCEVADVTTSECNGLTRVEGNLTTANHHAPSIIGKALMQTQKATVIIMDMASRYIVSPDRLSIDEVRAFAALQKNISNAASARDQTGKMARNIVVFLTNKQNDLPAWFFLENPSVKTIHIGNPTAEERMAMLEGEKLRSFFASSVYNSQATEFAPAELEKLLKKFVARTEGFSNLEFHNLRNLCRNQKIDMANLCSVVDLYTYGIQDNPWQSQKLMQELEDAEKTFLERVKGQDSALRQTLDVIKRSVVGMSGAQHSSDTKPKGILFFAGPTGTGKTETAKTLAQLIFGDEKACIRFDMSEYSQPHSDQRLLGAPPGYVGYEAGGQLTNAVRQRPFSILLFDEIEKAAPSIMDKFLQILEDGRMTDGQGQTTYFSECIIIFTSNLGITIDDEYGRRIENVTMDMPYEQVQKQVKEAIADHFKLKLGRPEILNRIGENVVVFDYIREPVAKEILHSKLLSIQSTLRENKHIELSWTKKAEAQLLDLAVRNLNNGGRGIMNVVEYAWINPLSRIMFDEHVLDHAEINVTSIRANEAPVGLEYEVKRK